MSATHIAPQLVGLDAGRKIVFPDEGSAPALRTIVKWKDARFFRIHKIGRRVFVDPEEMREDLSRRFRIAAVAAK